MGSSEPSGTPKSLKEDMKPRENILVDAAGGCSTSGCAFAQLYRYCLPEAKVTVRLTRCVRIVLLAAQSLAAVVAGVGLQYLLGRRRGEVEKLSAERGCEVVERAPQHCRA